MNIKLFQHYLLKRLFFPHWSQCIFLFNFRWICKTFTWFQGESYIAKYTRVTFASNLVPPHSLSLPINSHFTTVGFFFSVSICKCNKFHIYIYLYSSSMCVYIYTYTYTHVYLYLFNLFYIKYSLLFTGEGNGNPLQLQCSCLENSTDRGPWWVQSMGLQSLTQLSDWAHILSP